MEALNLFKLYTALNFYEINHIKMLCYECILRAANLVWSVELIRQTEVLTQQSKNTHARVESLINLWTEQKQSKKLIAHFKR